MCIECSGVHRQLGVHVSKVRSCTLDVKVWEPLVLQVCEGDRQPGQQHSVGGGDAGTAEGPAGPPAGGGSGRSGSTAVEQQQQRQQGHLKHTESWVWCDGR